MSIATLPSFMKDPTFSVLIAFLLLLMIAGRAAWRFFQKALYGYQQQVKAEIEEVSNVVKDAHTLLQERQESSRQMGQQIQALKDQTEKQIINFRTEAEKKLRHFQAQLQKTEKKHIKSLEKKAKRLLIKDMTDTLVEQAQHQFLGKKRSGNLDFKDYLKDFLGN